MYFKKLVEILIKLVAAIFLFVFMYYAFSFFDDSQDRKKCLRKKEMEFADVIIDIVDDSENKKQKLIILKEGQKIETYFTNGIWSNLEIGDSVVKSRGSFKFKVYGKMKTKILDFGLDCE